MSTAQPTTNACPNCPGSPVEYDSTRGCSYCTGCGAVVEESTITSELTFVEGADGSARMVGQFVSAERSGIRSIGLRNRRMMTTQSREETINNARRRFQEVANALRGLSEYHVDRAVQCYKLALSHNFSQGRKLAHVLAACLYVVCRQEKTMHMLIDFSDALHANVFALGSTFLKLIRLLNIQLPLIDPSLYISRFAAQLEFGDKLQAVTTDALRLVQRMKRDWIHYGRRPSGICGACLLIAARMHGFQRSQAEVLRVVKVCDLTLRKRLAEFSETPSAELTIDQFRNMELSVEANPPSFKRTPAHPNHGITSTSTAATPTAAATLSTTTNNTTNNTTAEEAEANLEMEAEMSMALRTDTLQQAAAPLLTSRKWMETEVDQDPSKWTDLSDTEVDAHLLQEEEAELKRQIWEQENKDWEEAQEVKRKRLLEEPAKEPKRRGRKAAALNGGAGKQTASWTRRQIPHGSSAEAAKEIIAKKLAPKISKKINYAALDQLFS